jgi:hypothetical protein
MPRRFDLEDGMDMQEPDEDLMFNLESIGASGPYLEVKWPKFFRLMDEDADVAMGPFDRDWLIRDGDTGAYAYQGPEGGSSFFLRVLSKKGTSMTLIDGNGFATPVALEEVTPFSYLPSV